MPVSSKSCLEQHRGCSVLERQCDKVEEALTQSRNHKSLIQWDALLNIQTGFKKVSCIPYLAMSTQSTSVILKSLRHRIFPVYLQ